MKSETSDKPTGRLKRPGDYGKFHEYYELVAFLTGKIPVDRCVGS